MEKIELQTQMQNEINLDEEKIKSFSQEINSKKKEMDKMKKDLSRKIRAKMMFFGEKVAKPKKPKKEKVGE